MIFVACAFASSCVLHGVCISWCVYFMVIQCVKVHEKALVAAYQAYFDVFARRFESCLILGIKQLYAHLSADFA